MRVTGGEDPKEKKPAESKSIGGYHKVRVKRNNVTGKLEQEGDITPTEVYSDDQRRAREAKSGSGTYEGSAAPRVGGVKVEKTVTPVGGTKSQVKSSARKIKRSSMSSKQKKSALRALNG